MMAGNPNWWSINGMHPQLSSSSHQFVYNGSSNPENPSPDEHPHQPNQDFPVRSWSQLLLGGLGSGGDEERFGASIFQQQKKLENWEDQVMMNNNNNNNINMNMNPPPPPPPPPPVNVDHVKQESTTSNVHLYHDFHHANNTTRPSSNSWNNSHHHHSNNSPTSCVTTNLSNNNNNFLNFSATAKSATAQGNNKSNHHNYQDRSSECNSTSTGGVSKKARVQQSSAQPALKVRKEKLGDRITALHQLVSPFGKTDTASVLSEAIGYIRFLQGQIEALSSPYMRNATGSTGHHQHSVQERNCLFPEEPGQFLNHDIGMDGRGAFKQDSQGRGAKDLRSRGLCLVPLSCTQHVGNDNGADYWAPAALGGGF